MNNKILIIIFLSIISIVGVVFAATPSGDLDGRSFYNIFKFKNINATSFYQNGYPVLDSRNTSTGPIGPQGPAGINGTNGINGINGTNAYNITYNITNNITYNSSFSGTISASNITDLPAECPLDNYFMTQFNGSNSVCRAVNFSGINITDLTYYMNSTQVISLISSLQTNITNINYSKLNITDQRFNETILINNLNTSTRKITDYISANYITGFSVECPSGNVFTSRPNGSTQICKSINESLFNVANIPVDSRYYLSTNPNGFLNATLLGNCSSGTVIQNITSNGIQCTPVSIINGSGSNGSGTNLNAYGVYYINTEAELVDLLNSTVSTKEIHINNSAIITLSYPTPKNYSVRGTNKIYGKLSIYNNINFTNTTATDSSIFIYDELILPDGVSINISTGYRVSTYISSFRSDMSMSYATITGRPGTQGAVYWMSDPEGLYTELGMTNYDWKYSDKPLVSPYIQINTTYADSGACNLGREGKIIYNSTSKKHFGCNSTAWVALY